MTRRVTAFAAAAVVSLTLLGCVVVEGPSGPYPYTDRKPDTNGQPFDEWLDTNVPVGTPRQEAESALCDAGLTCWYWDDSTIKCWFLCDAPGETRQAQHSLTVIVKDGKVAERVFR